MNDYIICMDASGDIEREIARENQIDGALSAGHQNITNWKHPELVTGEKLGAESTIAAILENEAGAAVVEKYLPGFSANEQAKPAYGMTFKALAPILGLPEQVVEAMLAELDAL